MRGIVAGLASGALFGVGLGVSGMTQADKVIGFLDITDAWDPSLMFTMLGAILVHLLAYRYVAGRSSPLLGGRFGIPTKRDIDPRLVGGAALFGIGWGLGGYCPGPGLVSMASGAGEALVFVATLTAGMLVFHVVEEALRAPTTPADEGVVKPVAPELTELTSARAS